MATIKPFRAYRPTIEAQQIACPPYDVISSEEARIMASGNDISFLHIDKPEIDLPKDINLYDPKVYAKGRENLDKFINAEILSQDETPCFYLYAQTMKGRTQYGLVAITSTEEYDKGIIRKHELTRKDKEEDRTNHIKSLQATTGPVFLTYPDNDTINKVIAEVVKTQSVYKFITPDGVKQEIWVISDKDKLNTIENTFKEIPILYIADGHHRSASASNVAKEMRAKNKNHTGTESYNYFLSVIFPASQMYIMAYNRLVKDLNGLTPETFLQALQKEFDISVVDFDTPVLSKEFCMYMEGKWYLLRTKKSTYNADDPVASLDVSLLQNKVLDPILSIKDPRTDKRITFVGGIRGTKALKDAVDGGKYKIAFSMYPTSIKELMKVADNNLIMPPKSTWFEPKLLSGLLIYKY